MQDSRGYCFGKFGKNILKSLNNDDVEEIEDSNSNFAETVLTKKMKTSIDLEWIPPTSNRAELLFSRVRYVLTDYRESLSPVNLETQKILHANKKYWTVFTIKEILSSYPDDKQ